MFSAIYMRKIKTAILTGDVSQVFRMVDDAEMDAQKTHWEEEELN